MKETKVVTRFCERWYTSSIVQNDSPFLLLYTWVNRVIDIRNFTHLVNSRLHRKIQWYRHRNHNNFGPDTVYTCCYQNIEHHSYSLLLRNSQIQCNFRYNYTCSQCLHCWHPWHMYHHFGNPMCRSTMSALKWTKKWAEELQPGADCSKPLNFKLTQGLIKLTSFWTIGPRALVTYTLMFRMLL
jgi:hypothetical protein